MKVEGKRPTPKTIDTAERVVSQFEEACGNPPLVKLKRQEGLKFQDWLLAQGQSPKTAADWLDVAEAVHHEGLTLPRVFPPEGWKPPPLVNGILTTQARESERAA